MEDVSVNSISETKRKISIKVDAQDVDKRFDKFFEGVKDDVQVPGFRKGKAPISRMKQLYGKKARPSVAQMLISDLYTKALKDHNFNPVGNPSIVDFTPGKDEYPGKFDFDNSYSAELIVEILPNVDPKGYKGLSLEFPEYNIHEAVERKMLAYREQFAEHKQVEDRPAQLGDSIVIDFVGRLKGESEPFEGGSAENFDIAKLGESNLISGFDDQLVGLSLGETKTINLKFPEDYKVTQLAGKETEFDVTLNSIVETKLSDVNEDLAMMAGFNTVEELKEHVNEEAKKEIDEKNRNIVESQIISELIEQNPFEIPVSMVDFEMQRLAKQLQGTRQIEISNDILNALRPAAEKNIAKAILLESIYEKEDDIEVAPDELDELLEDHAGKNNMSKDELVSTLYKTNQMDSFVGVLRARKVIDYIMDNSTKIKESEENDEQE